MADLSLGTNIAKLHKEAALDRNSGPATSSSVKSGLLAYAQEGGKKAMQTRFDHKIVKLFTVAQLPAALLDRAEFKDIITTANPKLTTFSSTTLTASLMPKQAARARQISITELRGLDNLTISYDGGTTLLVQSVYTVHVTTPDTRESHLLAGDESSGLSHSSEYIGNLLRICAVSDSTGNTKKAREDLALDFGTLFPLDDGAHPLNNLLKEIATMYL